MKKTILNALIVAGITLLSFATTAEASIAKGYYFIKTAYEYTNSEATIYDAKSEGLDVCRIHNCTYSAEDIFYIEEYETGKYIVQNAKTGRYMGTFSGNVQLTNQKSADLWMVIDEIDGGNIRIKASDQTYYYNWNGNQLNGGHPLDATYNYHDWRLEAVSNSVLASLGIDPTKTPSGSAIDDGDNTGGGDGETSAIAKGYYFIKSAYQYTNSEATIYDPKADNLDVCRIHNCTYAAEDIFYIEAYETDKYIIQNAKTGRYMGTFNSGVLLSDEKPTDIWMVIDQIDGGNIRIKASDQTNYYNWNGTQLNGGAPLNETYNYHDWTLESVPNSTLTNLGIDPTKTPSGTAIDDGDNTGGNTGGGDDDNSGIAKAYYFIKTAYTNASPEATIYDAKAEDLDICRIHNCTYAAEDIFYIEEYETGKYIIQNAKTGRYMGTFSGNVQLTDEKPTDIWMVIDQLDNGNIRIKASDQTCYYNWNGNQLNGGAGLNDTYNYHDWKLELVPNSTLTNLGIDPTKNPSGEIIGPGGGGNEDPDDDDDPGILKTGFYYIESAYNSGYVSPHSVIYDPVEDDMLKIRVNPYSKAEIFLIKKIALGKYTMQNAQTGRYVVGYEGTNYIALGNKPMEERWLQFMNIKDGVWRFRDSDQTCFYNWNGSYVNGGAGLNSTYNYHDWSIIPVDADMLESLGLSGDSLVIDPSNVVEEDPYIDAMWQSLGTSITWYNNNVSSAFTKGYQTRVREVLPFKRFSNKGVNASCLGGTESQVTFANYYTIEHGINDWGHATPVGTIDDYINDTKNGTFAANYRKVIDKIYSVNPNAMIVLCTPRKGYGFGGYLPDNCEDANKGIYLHEYADVIRQIAEYESLPVADFYALCGNQHNLASLSIDKALHPNDNGYQLMADVLVKAMRKVLVHPIIVPEVKETEE